ncbi:tripartite motif-containing protein 59-like [Mytilus edulis]|uniref:tripartite motif-containing protein 59-like n=1 Tax=Mytilus edulis TaxID=6550 RepID=UPI0039EE7811
MATAAKGEQEFDIFTCPICLEKLKSPKRLPCSHSFCEVCIGEFILSTEHRTGHKPSSYPCPVCRSVVTPTNHGEETSQWASSLPPNVSLPSQMDQSESTNQECHLCKTENNQNLATHWCRDCSDAFCDDCLRIHNRMKISADHKVVKIEEISKLASEGEPDFSFISDKCSVHTSKILEAFCFNHQALCCLLCVTAQHRKCDNVQAFEDMTVLNADKIESFESKLKEVKSKAEELIEEKKSNYEKLSSSFKDIELTAKTSAKSIKDRVDILLSSFLKELNMTRDEQKTVFEDKLKAAENLLGHIISLMKTTQSAREYGTLNHMFIHLKRSENKLKSKIEETSTILNKESVDETRFAMNDTFLQAEKAENFGKIDLTFNAPIYLNDCMYMNSLDNISIKNITLRHNKTMSLDFDVSAICMMGKVIFVGADGNLYAIDRDTGRCIAKTTFNHVIKRLACDIETHTIFVSCYDACIYTTIYTCTLQEREFKSHKVIKSGGGTNDGLCILDRLLYTCHRRR